MIGAVLVLVAAILLALALLFTRMERKAVATSHVVIGWTLVALVTVRILTRMAEGTL